MSRPLVTAVAPRWESQVAGLLTGSVQARLVRRCADLPELLGVTRAGLAEIVLVSHDLRGLDRDAVAALEDAGVHLVGLHPPDDEDAARSLQRRGVAVLLEADSSATELDAVLASLGHRSAAGADGEVAPDGGRVEPSPTTRADSAPLLVRALGPEGPSGAEEPAGAPADDAPGAGPGPDSDGTPPEGQVVVVWGPHGSTGRTTVAVNLAAELASPTVPVLLVDADTYGAGVAQALAVLDESPGVAAAARAADQGTLDADSLLRLAPQVRPGLRVLTGLPRADRWTELRETALADILQQARAVARWVVVDIAPHGRAGRGALLRHQAPRRNGAALCALQERRPGGGRRDRRPGRSAAAGPLRRPGGRGDRCAGAGGGHPGPPGPRGSGPGPPHHRDAATLRRGEPGARRPRGPRRPGRGVAARAHARRVTPLQPGPGGHPHAGPPGERTPRQRRGGPGAMVAAWADPRVRARRPTLRDGGDV